MRLEVVDELIIETYGTLEEHNKKVEEKIQQISPEFYSLNTDIICTVWKTVITVFEKA